MKNLTYLLLFSSAVISTTASSVQAHGWVEFPSARQNTCYLDGGFWDDAISNPACQAAFDQSGAYPFVQRNEFAANVANYNDMAHVQATVRDGSLCAAGDSAKSGLDIPSADWQKTPVVLDSNGEIELVFNATAPHNPSFWQFYLSKPGYDATQVLTWSDLELVDAKSNVTVDADKKYRIKIALPAERTGDAILFTRWQREDPAGEGFYNCSDIQFEGDGTVDPTLPDNTLTALGYFVSAGFGPVKDGDSVRLRTFDSDGQEIVDMTQSITTANIGSWAVELATRFNLLQQGQWVIGVWDEVTSQYQLDSDNVHVNQIFAPGSQLSYQLSLNKGEPPVEPSPDAWSVDSVYTAGDVVSHNGKQWTAQWWTKGEEPGTTGEWGVWR